MKNKHPQHRRDQEVRRRVGDADLCGGRGRGQRAREERPHHDVAEEVEAETDLFYTRGLAFGEGWVFAFRVLGTEGRYGAGGTHASNDHLHERVFVQRRVEEGEEGGGEGGGVCVCCSAGE